jgi:hypothetical protein
MRVRLMVAAPQLVGSGPAGSRRIVAITGGEFNGARLNGAVLPGGGDWTTQRGDHCTQLDARYTLECEDGALIYVQDRGLRHGPEHTMARLAKGEPVNPRDYYFRTAAQLETGSAKYAWLNRAVVVGSGMRQADEVTIDFYSVV